MTCNCDAPGFRGVLELTMAPLRPHYAPAICLDERNRLPDFRHIRILTRRGPLSVLPVEAPDAQARRGQTIAESRVPGPELPLDAG